MKSMVFLIFAILLICCNKDQELEMERKPYYGNELKIDGYFCGFRRYPATISVIPRHFF